MRGLTVATPEWVAIAEEAAARFQKFTGLPAQVAYVSTKQEARDVKLSLTGLTWFFDADLWFVRSVALPKPIPEVVYGTPLSVADESRKIVRGYARRGNVDPGAWITGSFYGCNWDAPRAADALKIAREYAATWAITDRDEEPLNVGYQRAGLPVAMLPSAYNWHPYHGCDGYGYSPVAPIAIHGGGMGDTTKRWQFLRDHTL